MIPILDAALAGRLPAAPEPPKLDEIPKVWKRIKKALNANADVKRSLNKGATEAQIAECEATLQVTFPPDLRASYLIHDGQKSDVTGLFPEEFADLDSDFALLPLAGIVSHWRTWKELDDSGDVKTRTAQADPGVRSDWWNPKWIPLAWDGGGDSLCLDLDATHAGTPGQIILLRHDDPARSKLAISVQELLNALAEHLEQLD